MDIEIPPLQGNKFDHPKECVLCCEDFPPLHPRIQSLSEPSSRRVLMCCGNQVCYKCLQSLRNMSCPFCRAPLPNSESNLSDILDTALKANRPWAFELAAQFHRYGNHGFAKNASLFYFYAKKAAEMGSCKALYYLGSAYEVGEGVPLCLPDAISCYMKASACNIAAASQALGRIFLHAGEDYMLNSTEVALRYFKLAVIQVQTYVCRCSKLHPLILSNCILCGALAFIL